MYFFGQLWALDDSDRYYLKEFKIQIGNMWVNIKLEMLFTQHFVDSLSLSSCN